MCVKDPGAAMRLCASKTPRVRALALCQRISAMAADLETDRECSGCRPELTLFLLLKKEIAAKDGFTRRRSNRRLAAAPVC